MKRMTLIAITLCAVLLATVGAGVIAAKQDIPQADRIAQFDVSYQEAVVGKLSVNANTWMYV